MLKSKLYGLCSAAALALTLLAPAAHADPLRYGYVALDQVPLPAPYAFFAPSAVVAGRVYGTVFDAAFSIENVAVYSGGTITVGPSGSATVAVRWRRDHAGAGAPRAGLRQHRFAGG